MHVCMHACMYMYIYDSIRQKAMLKDAMAIEGMGSVVYYVY
jgi:hypothetical protein